VNNQNIASLMIDMECATAGIRAMGHLISATMSQGDGLDGIALGVHHIMDKQVDEFNDLRAAIQKEFARLQSLTGERSAMTKERASKIAAKISEGINVDEIATAMNVQSATVERVIALLAGEAPTSKGKAINE
jgi:DNA-binding NarL/FixJ family response regulator